MSFPEDSTADAPHRIRLRGPWEAAWLDERGETTSFESFRFPGSWRELGPRRSARAVARRRFSQPANLDDSERVFLLCERLAADSHARLNGAPLDSSGRWDITERLAFRNLFELELTAGGPDEPVLPGEVRLEILGDPADERPRE